MRNEKSLSVIFQPIFKYANLYEAVMKMFCSGFQSMVDQISDSICLGYNGLHI